MHERAAEFKRQAEASFGIEVAVHEFPEGTKTAADAAAVVGCDLAQIASALAFVADRLVVVVTSGTNRVDTVCAARDHHHQSVRDERKRTRYLCQVTADHRRGVCRRLCSLGKLVDSHLDTERRLRLPLELRRSLVHVQLVVCAHT